MAGAEIIKETTALLP